jgi:hypothetical protein
MIMARRITARCLTLASLLAASVPAAAAALPYRGEPDAMAVPAVAVLAATAATSEQLWSLRSGLNVAALMCADRDLALAYNWLLRAHAPALAQAWSNEQRRFQAQHGSQWQAAQDRHLTIQYNLFANTGDRVRFCAEARSILSQARMVPTHMFGNFAAAAANRLPRHVHAATLAAR